jgi:hypothetical protein
MSPTAAVPDISQGGTVDVVQTVYAPILLAYMRGVRRVLPNVFIDLADSDSTDIQRRIMQVVLASEFANDPKIRWTCHNYADMDHLVWLAANAAHAAAGEPLEPYTGQDYSSMAGMQSNDGTIFKQGFKSVFDSDPLHREGYVSEVGKATGPNGGIATDSDMDRTIEYVNYMLTNYPEIPILTIMQPKIFFTRRPVNLWNGKFVTPALREQVEKDTGAPLVFDEWCTWTYNPEREPDDAHPLSTIRNLPPVVSPDGAQLASLFGPVQGGDVGHRTIGRRG